jgi:tubulin--tyrosine ligase
MQVQTFKFQQQTPTFIELGRYLHQAGWRETEPAQLTDRHFDFPALQHLEFKHLLSALLHDNGHQIQPLTFYIDDHQYLEVIKGLSHLSGPWILKPSMLNNGQHIQLFENTQQLLKYYCQPKRMGGPHVLQQYIHPPHLLQGPEKGHKYSIRMFVVMTAIEAFLYPHGYFNVALRPYQSDQFQDKRAHLTNEHLSDDVVNVVQVPTVQYPMFQRFFPQIRTITSELCQAFYRQHQAPETFKYAFLGVDFMLDAMERVWLLEVNHGPCFPTEAEHPLYQKLYQDFWQSFIQQFLYHKQTVVFIPL